MISFRSLQIAFAAIAFLAQSGAISGASAQYPDRRVTFVVPYPAGGAADTIGRLLATKLSEAWKRPVVVENKSGGGGIVGNDYVAKAPGRRIHRADRHFPACASAECRNEAPL